MGTPVQRIKSTQSQDDSAGFHDQLLGVEDALIVGGAALGGGRLIHVAARVLGEDPSGRREDEARLRPFRPMSQGFLGLQNIIS